ncbi:hypothetical protein GE061_007940 [Apolygus lucorum]|uniref:Uncharacterized protein n=1 Tax=Apolygus lucorum TaxID=248454 RepID=A0A8S9WNC1_APOLU|nr:hypothetical protein GE061_007940 [Apolygus lucorum]
MGKKRDSKLVSCSLVEEAFKMGTAESKSEEMDSNRRYGLDSMEIESNEVCSGRVAELTGRKSVSNRTSENGEVCSRPDSQVKDDTDRVKLERVDDSSMQAMIIKYFTQQKCDSVHNVLEKRDGLRLKDFKETVKDVEEETSSNGFSQLCASNFIQLGPSLIGYPASSWIQNGAYVIPLEEFNGEQEGSEPKPVQIWVTQQSHPSTQMLKNDMFLKMCAVQEYLPKTAKKEGISDFVNNFQQTGRFDQNVKEYSASWESIIKALTLKPQFVNDVRNESNSKHKYQYMSIPEACDPKELQIGEQKHETVSSEESSNQICKSGVSKNGTAGNADEVDEASGNESTFDLASGFSELSIDGSASKSDHEETENDSPDPQPSVESMLKDSPFVQRMIDDLAKIAENKVFRVPDKGTDSESTSDSGETNSLSESSSGTITEGEMSDARSKSSKQLYRKILKEDLRRKEVVKKKSLPDSLMSILSVVHPRRPDVVSELSLRSDSCQKKKKLPKPINVVSSSDEVASSLMKALETTCSKTNEATNGSAPANNSSGKSKGSATNSESAGSPKPNGSAKEHDSPQSLSSSSKSSNKGTKKHKKRKASKKDAKDSSSGSVKNLSSSNVQKIAQDGKIQSNSTAGSNGGLSHDKVLDLVAALKLQPKKTSSVLGLHQQTATGSNMPFGTVPSTSKTSAPPMGAILEARPPAVPVKARPPAVPVKARSFPQEDKAPGAKVLPQYYSNNLEEFGRFLTKSMESMTMEQRTHAITIIYDVLVEGNNNSLCQYTRLSGIRNEPISGKEVFRMGPSHVSDSSLFGNFGFPSTTPSMSYGFPQRLPAATCPSYPSTEPSLGLGSDSQTPSLPVQKPLVKQKAASKKNDVTIQSIPNSGQGGLTASSKRKNKKANQQHKKSSPEGSQVNKTTRTMKFYPSGKPPPKQNPTPAGSGPKNIKISKTQAGAKQTQAQNHQGIPNPPGTSQKSPLTPQSQSGTAKPKVHLSYWALKKKNQKLKKSLQSNS